MKKVRYKGKLIMSCTVGELASELVRIYYSVESGNNFPDCSFAAVDEIYETVEESYENAHGWYGIKSIDTGFDSDRALLISDYYGGGARSIGDYVIAYEAGKENMEKTIFRMLMETLSYEELLHASSDTEDENQKDEKTPLIVEFEEEKGEHV